MDNHLQIAEIEKYDQDLFRETGVKIPLEIAALVWVRKYARIWRLQHPASEAGTDAACPSLNAR